MSDDLMAIYDHTTESVIIRRQSGQTPIVVFDLSEAESFASEVLAASRGQDTGYTEFLQQERGIAGTCAVCGEEVIEDPDGSPEVYMHADADSPTRVDHDADADHTPVLEDPYAAASSADVPESDTPDTADVQPAHHHDSVPSDMIGHIEFEHPHLTGLFFDRDVTAAEAIALHGEDHALADGEVNEPEYRRMITLPEGQTLRIVVTDEGIITDLIVNGEVVGTTAATFGEIANRTGL